MMEAMKSSGVPVWRRLSGIALLLLILPRFVIHNPPYRWLLEGAGVIVLILAIVLMFTARGNRNCSIGQ